MLIVKFVLEQVLGGGGRLTKVYLTIVHRSVIGHGHSKDGVWLCVATARADKALLRLLVVIFVVGPDVKE